MKTKKIEKEITYKGYKGCIILTWYGEFLHWRSAYVFIPKNNKFHGKHYSECDDLDVHGGVTFSEIGKIFKTKIEDDLELPDDAWVLGIGFNRVLGEWDIKDVKKELKRFINVVIKAGG